MACLIASPLKLMMNDIEVARLGKTVGLKGDLKLHDLSDFPEQFRIGATFFTPPDKKLKISAYNANKNLVRFESHESIEDAKPLTNAILYTSIEETKTRCSLGDNEYFWFDIEGCSVFEKGTLLGEVDEVERIGSEDYLHVKSEKTLVENGAAPYFLIPYVNHFICNVSIVDKHIEVMHARDLLENL